MKNKKEITKDDVNESITKGIKSGLKLKISEKELNTFFETRFELESFKNKKYDLTIKELFNSFQIKFRKEIKEYQKPEIILFFKTNKTCYGLDKKFEYAANEFKNDPELAVKKGLCDTNGNPLYQRGPGRGNIIIHENIWEQNVIGIAIYKNNHTKKIKLNLIGKSLDLDIPLCKKLSIEGYFFENTLHLEKKKTIKILDETYISIENYRDSFPNSFNMSIDEIKSLAEDKTNYNDFFINEVEYNIRKVSTGFYVYFSLIEFGFDISNDNNCGECYSSFLKEIPNGIELNGKGYLIGKPYINKKGELKFNLYSICKYN